MIECEKSANPDSRGVSMDIKQAIVTGVIAGEIARQGQQPVSTSPATPADEELTRIAFKIVLAVAGLIALAGAVIIVGGLVVSFFL